MFLNDAKFASDGISMLSFLLTHLNPSSIENLLLAILDLTRLEMGLGESRIDCMLRVQDISKCMHRITMERIIHLFAIAIIYHDRYPGVTSHYIAGDAALVNCNLFDISSILSRKETRQQALVIPSATPPTAGSNHVSNTLTKPPLTVRPAPRPTQPPPQTSALDYPPLRGVPWNCISTMVRTANSFTG